jgi:hypothetical protein
MFGVFARFEKPEVDVAFVVLVGDEVGGKIHVAAIALDAFGGLADLGLFCKSVLCVEKKSIVRSCARLTSLYEMETPGNFTDGITVTPRGFGGNEAAETVSAREQNATKSHTLNMTLL